MICTFSVGLAESLAWRGLGADSEFREHVHEDKKSHYL
jgi:hypothetical protein